MNQIVKVHVAFVHNLDVNQIIGSLNQPTHEPFSTCRIAEQKRLRRAFANAQTRQSLFCSYTQSMEVDEDSDQILDLKSAWALIRGFVHMR